MPVLVCCQPNIGWFPIVCKEQLRTHFNSGVYNFEGDHIWSRPEGSVGDIFIEPCNTYFLSGKKMEFQRIALKVEHFENKTQFHRI